MDAVEYLKTIKRMCEWYKPICWGENNQTPCKLRIKACKEGMGCVDYCNTYPEEAVKIVEQWAKEHPKKTRQSEFLKMFPNVELFSGVISINPCTVDTTKFNAEENTCSDCEECGRQFWNEEVE